MLGRVHRDPPGPSPNVVVFFESGVRHLARQTLSGTVVSIRIKPPYSRLICVVRATANAYAVKDFYVPRPRVASTKPPIFYPAGPVPGSTFLYRVCFMRIDMRPLRASEGAGHSWVGCPKRPFDPALPASPSRLCRGLPCGESLARRRALASGAPPAFLASG
jgi:hypothetical protein